jgi:hypothetical protein
MRGKKKRKRKEREEMYRKRSHYPGPFGFEIWAFQI